MQRPLNVQSETSVSDTNTMLSTPYIMDNLSTGVVDLLS